LSLLGLCAYLGKVPGGDRVHCTNKIGLRGKKSTSAGILMFLLRLPASIRSRACTGLDACSGPSGCLPACVSQHGSCGPGVSPIPVRDRNGAEAIRFERDPEGAEARDERILTAIEEERQ
jgi:hypothetical protein